MQDAEENVLQQQLLMDQDACIICYEDVKEPVSCSVCSIVTCKACALRWIEQKNQCPHRCHEPPWRTSMGVVETHHQRDFVSSVRIGHNDYEDMISILLMISMRVQRNQQLFNFGQNVREIGPHPPNAQPVIVHVPNSLADDANTIQDNDGLSQIESADDEDYEVNGTAPEGEELDSDDELLEAIYVPHDSHDYQPLNFLHPHRQLNQQQPLWRRRLQQQHLQQQHEQRVAANAYGDEDEPEDFDSDDNSNQEEHDEEEVNHVYNFFRHQYFIGNREDSNNNNLMAQDALRANNRHLPEEGMPVEERKEDALPRAHNARTHRRPHHNGHGHHHHHHAHIQPQVASGEGDQEEQKQAEAALGHQLNVHNTANQLAPPGAPQDVHAQGGGEEMLSHSCTNVNEEDLAENVVGVIQKPRMSVARDGASGVTQQRVRVVPHFPRINTFQKSVSVKDHGNADD